MSRGTHGALIGWNGIDDAVPFAAGAQVKGTSRLTFHNKLYNVLLKMRRNKIILEDIVRAMGFLCLGSRMKRIAERLQADTQRVIDAYGVAVQAGQFPFLAAIDRFGPLGIGELADAVGITQPGATRTASQLVRQGLVDVQQSPEDQRRKVLSLTASGRQIVAFGKAEVWPAIEAAVADLCGTLDGPLLGQLASIEDGLAERSLGARIVNAGETPS